MPSRRALTVAADGLWASIVGAFVGAGLVAMGVTITEIVHQGAIHAVPWFIAVFTAAFVVWWVAILLASPLWALMHFSGLTKPLHAAMLGALAPGLVTLVCGAASIAMVFSVIGALVGAAIQRVYYGQDAS